MNERINAAREILAGMYEACDRYHNAFKPVPQRVQDDIDRREAEIADMERQHRQQFGSRSCRCNAHLHGGDCMCFED